MPTSRKNCLDNASLPHKGFREVIAKRRRADGANLRRILTPSLRAAITEYKEEGRKMGAEAVNKMHNEVGAAMLAALDGEYSLENINCVYCDFLQKEEQRRKEASDADRVRRQHTSAFPLHAYVARGRAAPGPGGRASLPDCRPAARLRAAACVHGTPPLLTLLPFLRVHCCMWLSSFHFACVRARRSTSRARRATPTTSSASTIRSSPPAAARLCV